MRDDDVLAIRVSQLRGDLKIPFDVYIKVGGRFIHYCRQGSSFEGARLRRLKEKKLKHLYVPRGDESKFQNYVFESIESAYDPHCNKPLEVRAEVVHGAQETMTTEFFDNPNSPDRYMFLLESSERFAGFLAENRENLLAILLNIENIDNNIAHHGVAVAAIDFYLARYLKIGAPEDIKFMITGCLSHDLEHAKSGFDVLKPHSKLSMAERKTYEAHPRAALERFEKYKPDPLVSQIILQHEETIDGSGFPSHLREKHIDPRVLLATVANAYDRLVSFERKSPQEALQTLLQQRAARYPRAHLEGLDYILNWTGLLTKSA